MALTDAERERVRVGHLMEDLIASPAWKELGSWIESNPGAAAFARLKAPAASFDACLGIEFEKGTLRGIELTFAAPANIVAEMKDILARNVDEDGEEDGRRNVDYDDRSKPDSASP